MKKTFAVLLACIMLLASIPFTVSAAEVIKITTDTNYTENIAINAGETIEIEANVTISAELENNGTIIIYNGGSLTVISGGKLENYGNIEVRTGGKLDVINGGIFNNYVTIPGSFSRTYDWKDTWNRQPLTVQFDVAYYMYRQGDTDDAYADIKNYTNFLVADETVAVPYGEELFIMVVPRIGPKQEGEWVGAERLKLKVGSSTIGVTTVLDTESENAVRLPEYGAVFTVVPSNSFKVEVASTEYKDIVKIFDIALPQTEGYYVITDKNEVNNVKVEFGKTLSFRVVLEPDYDKSEPSVYVNTIYMEPADFGYYRVAGPMESEGFATAGGVQDHLVITVMGVASNESQEQMSSLVLMLQEIFSIIQEIFSYFTSLFTGFGTLGGGTTDSIV